MDRINVKSLNVHSPTPTSSEREGSKHSTPVDVWEPCIGESSHERRHIKVERSNTTISAIIQLISSITRERSNSGFEWFRNSIDICQLRSSRVSQET